MRRLDCACAVLAVLLCAAAEQKIRSDRKEIQGVWVFESMEQSGKSEAVPREMRLTFTAETFAMQHAREDPMGGKYKLDPAADPKTIDLIVEENPGHPIHQPGIYLLDGDTLKLCVAAAGKPRPSAFSTKAGDFNSLWLLHRRQAAAQVRRRGGPITTG